jgi:UDPglucose 6-dehydrogenase
MFARRVAVLGTGYVGLTTGACLASLGHHVVCADVDPIKVERLSRGNVDILEPGLPELVAEGLAAGRLSFVLGAGTALADQETSAEVVFLCLPTPMGVGGIADLSAVESVAEEIRELLPPGAVVVNKSTVPVGTAAWTKEVLGRDDVAVVSNPEFLREGSAVDDFLNPDRIVVGCDAQDAAERVAALYARLGAPTVLTDCASAELVKYAANCFLAMKLSYLNALVELCERLGADIADVTEGMGYDRRIGQEFLAPGRAGVAHAFRRTLAPCCRSRTPPISSSGCYERPSTPTTGSSSESSTRCGSPSPVDVEGHCRAEDLACSV